MQVVTWNLYRGRAKPPAGRPLLDEFAATLAGWAWDVALLQEVPPWWPRPLAERARASMRMTLTGRNQLHVLRRALAERWPDAVKSSAGGCDAILVRGQPVVAHGSHRLRRLPEQRWVHAVQLADLTVVANLHAQTQPRERPERDIARAAAWLPADVPAVVLGGDFNIPDPVVPGMAGKGRGVDHVLARGLTATRLERLRAGPLSDHAPLRVTFARP